MNHQETSRYFIGITPPASLSEELTAFKKYLGEQFGAIAALRSPPHLTLHMPFSWKNKKEDLLIKNLSSFSSTQKALSLQIDNFGCFAPRVIYASVEPDKKLEELQLALHRYCKKSLGLFNSDYKDMPWHPHITIAFRDLKKNVFQLAWEEFRERPFRRGFLADKIVLFKHAGTNWDEFKSFSLH